MKVLIQERLSEHRYKTPEGYLICTDAILARTGKQTYKRNEIFADSEDDSEVEVDRPTEEVFSEQAIASFENKPLANEHPDEDINPSNYKELAVGFVRDVHKGVVNGQEVLLGTLVITDQEAIEDVESGRKPDLSCGYDCDILDEENPCQRNIRGNHVALCEQGRAGIARIVDSKCKDFDDTGKNIRVVKAFIEQNGNKFDKRKDANAILEYIKKRTGIVNADYADVLYIIKEYTRAEITDSVNDAKKRVLDFKDGYAIVQEAAWKKYGRYAYVERHTNDIKEARYWKSSLETADNIICVIVDVRFLKVVDSVNNIADSVNDKLIDVPQDILKKFEIALAGQKIKIEKQGKTWSGNVHYQVSCDCNAEMLFRKLKLVDIYIEKFGVPMVYSVDGDKYGSTAGIDLLKQHVDDSMKDADQIFRVLALVPGEYDDEPGFYIIFNVKANSEKEAIAKAEKYAEKTPAYRFAWDFRIAKPNQHARIERNVDSISDASGLTRAQAIQALKSSHVEEYETWDAGYEKNGWYVQIQNMGTKTLRQKAQGSKHWEERTASKAWGRIWYNGKFMFGTEQPITLCKKEMIMFLQQQVIDSVIKALKK